MSIYVVSSMSGKKRNVTGKKEEDNDWEMTSGDLSVEKGVRPSAVDKGKGCSVEKGKGPVVEKGKGSLVEKGKGSSVEKGKGPLVEKSKGSSVEKGKGPLVEKGKGSSVEKGKGSSVEKGECSGVSTSSPGSSSRRDDSPSIIAYVHNVSEPKRNRRNTMDYYTMDLQTTEGKLPALIYSKSKRKLLADKGIARTPVKLQRFTYTSDGSKVIVNDMTKISSPQPTEYSFQFKEQASAHDPQKSVKEILESCNEGEVMCVRGKIVGMGEASTARSNKLRVANAVFADQTGRIDLDLWEDHINAVQVGKVYCICPVQVRRWLGKKKISTVVRTTIKPQNMDALLSEIALVSEEEFGEGFGSNTRVIPRFQCVEKVETYLQCMKCSRKILQAMGSSVVRCDRCGYSMRTVDCPVRRYASVVLEAPDGTDGKPVHVTVFNDVLEKLVPNCKDRSDAEVAEMLLMVENITITYDSDTSIVLRAVTSK